MELYYKSISVEMIVPNPEQPRRTFDEAELQSLAQSITANGLIQPIVVEEADGYFILHDGERRWRAHKLAGLSVIGAVVEPARNGTGPQDRLTRALVANVQRQDLNPMEEALAIRAMLDKGMTRRQVINALGWSEPKVVSRLKLLELDEELQQLVATGSLPLSERVTGALLSIADRDARVRMGQRLARPGVTINAIVNACTKLVERMAEANQVRSTQVPALGLALANKTTPDRTERWANVRAAAAGMCEQCDANPRVPAAPDPAWSLIMPAAAHMCQACNLRELATHGQLDICKTCPAVELLKRLVGGVQ